MTDFLQGRSKKPPQHLRDYMLCKLFSCKPSEIDNETAIRVLGVESAQEAMAQVRNEKMDGIFERLNIGAKNPKSKQGLDNEGAIIMLLQMIALEIM